jgi:hypothetical protein
MGKKVEISKTVNVQIDYVSCADCCTELDFDVRSDSYGDIQIEVNPHDCDKHKE